MKKALIITYYWPPSGGAGVQRWLKFAKYLPEFGWEPIIYTPENPEAPEIDESLLRDVREDQVLIKQPIWEPYQWYRSFIGQKDKKIGAGFVSEEKDPGLLNNIAVWVRGNLFIPDARKFWIKPSVKFLTDYLQKNPVDVVISTGPPHSMHLVALELKRKLGVKWVADFRDPWTNIDFYRELKLSKRSDRLHRKMEQEVLTEADMVLTIGYTMTEEMKALGAKRVETITNGFDEADFSSEPVNLDDSFTISHIGTFSPSRNHPAFWQALLELKSENSDFAKKLKIRTVGVVDHSVKESIQKFGLIENWEQIPYVPHDQVLNYQRSSHVLLVAVNNTPNAKGILPGKFFEYLASGRPILAIGPKDSDIGKVLNETGAGVVAEPKNLEEVKNSILNLFATKEDCPADNEAILGFSRSALTKKLADQLNQITG